MAASTRTSRRTLSASDSTTTTRDAASLTTAPASTAGPQDGDSTQLSSSVTSPSSVPGGGALPTGVPGGDGGDEPDDEPTPDGSEASGDENKAAEESKPPVKIDIRNIKIEKFDGHVESGAFDSNVRDWWEEFEDQVADAQLLAGQSWPEDAKLSVLKMHLTGMARRWFRTWRNGHQNSTLLEAGEALIEQFRSRLTDPKIAQKIAKEGKSWGETYREYADRLLGMTDAMEGGNRVASNARHALDAFVNLAWPKYTDHLKTVINLRSSSPVQELGSAVMALMDFAGTDGKAHSRPKPILAVSNQKKSERRTPNAKSPKAPTKVSQTPKKRGAQANAAVVERKQKKPKKLPPRNKFACYICGDSGHIAKFHRQYLSGDQETETENGSANQAAAAINSGSEGEPSASSDAKSEDEE